PVSYTLSLHDALPISSRAENVRRAAHLAQMLNANGIHAVVALVSPSAQARAAAYQVIGSQRCREIHVSTPLAVCEQRDTKGLYRSEEHTSELQSRENL